MELEYYFNVFLSGGIVPVSCCGQTFVAGKNSVPIEIFTSLFRCHKRVNIVNTTLRFIGFCGRKNRFGCIILLTRKTIKSSSAFI